MQDKVHMCVPEGHSFDVIMHCAGLGQFMSKGSGLMSPLTVGRDSWLVCLQDGERPSYGTKWPGGEAGGCVTPLAAARPGQRAGSIGSEWKKQPNGSVTVIVTCAVYDLKGRRKVFRVKYH